MRWWGWIWIKVTSRDSVMSQLITFLCSLYSHFYVWICPLIVMTGCAYTLLKMNTKKVIEYDWCHPSREEKEKGRPFSPFSIVKSVSLQQTLEWPWRIFFTRGALVLFTYDMTLWVAEAGERLYSWSYWHTYLLVTHVSQACCSTYESICVYVKLLSSLLILSQKCSHC